MADAFDKAKRREIMSRVRGANTKPELAVRRLLFAWGYRYRLHRKDLPGTPDIVLPGRRLVIEVNGCFWHGCPYCRRARIRPVANRAYWDKKLDGNLARDERNRRERARLGWRTLVIWECETKKPEVLAARLRRELAEPGESARSPGEAGPQS